VPPTIAGTDSSPSVFHNQDPLGPIHYSLRYRRVKVTDTAKYLHAHTCVHTHAHTQTHTNSHTHVRVLTLTHSY
jgi:hypothetical protein